jgi:hypothetical protein
MTDADGRYVIEGLGQEPIGLLVNDGRYAPESFLVQPGQESAGELALKSPCVLRGRLLSADTHKALAGVRVTALKAANEYMDLTSASALTDADGLFGLPLKTGISYSLEFVPPEGMPYVSVTKRCSEVVPGEKEAEFTLAPGVCLAGCVTDASTGKPVPNVAIRYLPSRYRDSNWRDDFLTCFDGRVLTNSKGRFSLVVTRAGGSLFLHAQEDEYRVVATDFGLLWDGKKTGQIRHCNAVIPIDPDGAGSIPELKVELRRGLTVTGLVLRPDGQSVTGGYLVCRRRVWTKLEELRPVMLGNKGTFSIEGCEPGRAERVLVKDSSGKWGAVADILPTPGAEPVTIRMERCGQAMVTLVDGDGLPLPNVRLNLKVGLPDTNSATGKAGTGDWQNAHILGANTTMPALATDRNGQILLSGLVPNATYRLEDQTETIQFGNEIQVIPGQELQMKIVVQKTER